MEKIKQLATELLARCQTVNLASLETGGFPRPVPMKPLRTEGAGVVWLATGIGSEKTAEFGADPRAGLSAYEGGDSVVLTGTVEVFTDRATREREWQEWMLPHFPGGIDDPDYCLLRFKARRATYYIGGEFVKSDV